MKTVHGAELTCVQCKLKFPNISTYDVHNKKKHSNKYKCQTCKKTFSDRCFLMEHMKDKHTITIDLVEETPESQEEEPREGRVQCFICGHTDSSQADLDKHMQEKHIDKVQTLYCKKCKFTAKDNDHMKDHEAAPLHNKSNPDTKCRNGADCRWFRQGRCNFGHEDLPAPNVKNVKECRHGDACHKKAQGKCSFYHRDVGVQQAFQPVSRSEHRSSPSSQWKTVNPRWHHNDQQHTQKSHVPTPQHQDIPLRPVWQQSNQQQNPLPPVWQRHQNVDVSWPPPSLQPQAWCRHGNSCNNGRFCELRNFSIQDFIQLQVQMRM